jgi:hypothetical protein
MFNISQTQYLFLYRQEIKHLATPHLHLAGLKASLFRKKNNLKKIFEFIRITNVSPMDEGTLKTPTP